MQTMRLLSRKQYGPMSGLVFSDDKPGLSVSEVYNIDSYAMVCFKSIKIYKNNTPYIRHTIGIKKHESANDVKVTMKLVLLGVKEPLELLTCTESWSSYDIVTKPYGTYDKLLEVMISLEVSQTEDPVRTKLYADDQFTDFELCADDGSVGIHKAVMAVHSDKFKTMLAGTWKEPVNKSIHFKDSIVETLQHLKDYMYLGIVPQNELHLCSLLLIGQWFGMTDLKTKCAAKLIHTVRPENFLDLLDFSRENDFPELTFAILQFTPEEVIKASEKQIKMSKCLNKLLLK